MAEEVQQEQVRYMGRISRSAYERHARSPEVQELIQSARQSWQRRYGVDPAAARVERIRQRGSRRQGK